MLTLNNVTTLNAYDRSTTLGPVPMAEKVLYLVANNPVFCQLAPHSPDKTEQPWGQEILITPQSAEFQRVQGARFRSAIPGLAAQVVAILIEPGDPLPVGGNPFTASLSASGIVNPTGPDSLVTGDLVWSVAATRSNAVLADGSTYDGTNPIYTALWVALGSVAPQNAFVVPDLRERVAVGVGPNTARLSNDGVAIGNRHGTRHRHSVQDPTHQHSMIESATRNATAIHTFLAANDWGIAADWAFSSTELAATGISVRAATGAADPLDGPGFVGLNPFLIL